MSWYMEILDWIILYTAYAFYFFHKLLYKLMNYWMWFFGGCRRIEENINRTYWTACSGSEVDLQEQGERFKVISWCWESQRWVKVGASCGRWEQRKKDSWEVKSYKEGKDFKIFDRNKVGGWQTMQEGTEFHKLYINFCGVNCSTYFSD